MGASEVKVNETRSTKLLEAVATEDARLQRQLRLTEHFRVPVGRYFTPHHVFHSPNL